MNYLPAPFSSALWTGEEKEEEETQNTEIT